MIYADTNAQAPLSNEVREYLKDRLENGPFANPNSIHCLGQKVMKGLENCRQLCAEALGARPEQVIFNSGASESIATIFHSVLGHRPVGEKNIIVTSPIEHSAVDNCCQYYQTLGYEIIKVSVNQQGLVDFDELEEILKKYLPKVALVTIMAANNETGVIQPFEKIAALCLEKNVPSFSDTSQYIGKTSFDFNRSKLDFACLSGHKIGALTGCGLILAKNWQTLTPLIRGGGQEKGMRGGTQNYIGNETLAVALTQLKEEMEKYRHLEAAKCEFERALKDKFPNIQIIGDKAPRLPTTTLVAYPGIHGQAVQIELESSDIYVSTSSACSDNQPASSKVLQAMQIPDDIGRGVIRIGLGLAEHPKQVYDRIYEVLVKAYEKLSKLKSF